MVTLVVFTSEHYPKKHRFCLTNLITWSPNFVIFAIMAWAAGDWRTLQRVSAAFAIPCILILAFLSESPRFLVQCRRMADAKAAILRMHRIDGRHCDESVLDAVLAREERQHVATKGQKKYNYLHLFYTWRFVRYTTSVALSFFVVSLVNVSLLYTEELLGVFRYSMNLAISFGDMRFKWLGRKFVHFFAEALAATALLLYITLDLTGFKSALPFVANWSLLGIR
uniref:MFS domain-containing protein n=1 Tax=Globodera pallida TaxID=36090 RepID=A0A183CH23_GLOPA